MFSVFILVLKALMCILEHIHFFNLVNFVKLLIKQTKTKKLFLGSAIMHRIHAYQPDMLACAWKEP